MTTAMLYRFGLLALVVTGAAADILANAPRSRSRTATREVLEATSGDA